MESSNIDMNDGTSTKPPAGGFDFYRISTILSHLMIQGIDFDFSPKDSSLWWVNESNLQFFWLHAVTVL